MANDGFLKILSLDTGEYTRLQGGVTCVRTDVGYMLMLNRRVLFLQADNEGAITTTAANQLSADGFACRDTESIFGRPDLSSAVFGWSLEAELDAIQRMLRPLTSMRGLDVGCGYGRLLVEMLRAGYTLDGIDYSLSSVEHLKRSLLPSLSGNVYCADICDFAAPDTYDFAFAALNTVRYIPSWSAFRRHLRLMAKSLRSSGRYAFHVLLSDTGDTNVNICWPFEFCQKAHTAEWTLHSIDRLNMYSVENAVVRCVTDDLVICQERQHQLVMTTERIVAEVAAVPNLALVAFCDESGRVLDRARPRDRNTWCLVEKVGS